jgi:anti-sigma regulatory factor (Ser/Thr protein kinase)
VLFTSEGSPETPDDDLQFMADGVIHLDVSAEGRMLSVAKLRGSDFRSGQHAMILTAHDIEVLPQLLPEAYRQDFVAEALPSGVPELDELLHGGLERGTISIISGPAGVGKTTLGLQFMKEAAGRGERSVVYTFEEGLETLVHRCESVNTSHARVALTGQLTNICADVSLLKMALTNLLANALKFIPPGAPPDVTIAAAITPERCRIEVQDRGIGIAPEDQERIFAPLVRLHGMQEYPGNGLGLAIVAKAVNMMGGRVGVTSAPGQGSTFWIELPHVEVGREVPDHR